MTAKFGPAGNAAAFYREGHKSSVEAPRWLHGMGLTAYEYQCSRGVHIGEASARQIGEEARKYDISLSIHAPYYINLASEDPKIQASSRRHLIASLQAARWMGATRVVFHPGATKPVGRARALDNARRLLAGILEEAVALGYGDILLAPETMGKYSQLGTLTEVLALCRLSAQVIPTLDFGHLHAVTGGEFTVREAFRRSFATVADALGPGALKRLHIHFSPVEFTRAGERRHWTFQETHFGPPFLPLAEVLVQEGLEPTVISESAGTQAEDALTMQEIYRQVLEKRQSTMEEG